MCPDVINTQPKAARACRLINVSAGMALSGIILVFGAAFLSEKSELIAEIFLKLGCTMFVVSPLVAIVAMVRISLKSYLTGQGAVFTLLATVTFLLLVGVTGFSAINPVALCNGHMDSIGRSLRMFANKHDGYLPAHVWCDSLIKDTGVNPETFRCLVTRVKNGECSYAMNKAVSNMRASDCPNDIVVLFETDSGRTPSGRTADVRTRHSMQDPNYASLKGNVYEHCWNQVGGPELISISHHDEEGCNVLFGDFETGWVSRSELPKLRWVVDDANFVFPMQVLGPEPTHAWRTPVLIGMAILVLVGTVWAAIAFKVWQCWIWAVMVGLLSGAFGAFFGIAAEDLYMQSNQNNGDIGGILGFLFGIAFVAFVKAMATHVPQGRLRLFSVSTGMAVGALCSTVLHLALMIVRLEPSPLNLVAGLPFGIMSGGVLGFIAGRFLKQNLKS